MPATTLCSCTIKVTGFLETGARQVPTLVFIKFSEISSLVFIPLSKMFALVTQHFQLLEEIPH